MSKFFDLQMTGPELDERLDKIDDVYTKSEVYTKQETDEVVGAEASIRANSDTSLQDQIDEIAESGSIQTLTANKSLVEVGQTTSVALNATTSLNASVIRLLKESTQITQGSGTQLSYTDSVSPTEAGIITYYALFDIGNSTKEKSINVNAVLPIYYGAGASYTGAQTKAPLRTSPVGSYTIAVGSTGQYMFFLVPSTMSIRKVTMNGFDVPMQNAVDVVINGFSYKSYQTFNTYDAGAYDLKIES